MWGTGTKQNQSMKCSKNPLAYCILSAYNLSIFFNEMMLIIIIIVILIPVTLISYSYHNCVQGIKQIIIRYILPVMNRNNNDNVPVIITIVP